MVVDEAVVETFFAVIDNVPMGLGALYLRPRTYYDYFFIDLNFATR